jgi:hypothetical protein
MFWSHTPRQPWQDEKYYEQQRKILRPANFERLHRNQWVSSESRFIDPELWSQNVNPALRQGHNRLAIHRHRRQRKA